MKKIRYEGVWMDKSELTKEQREDIKKRFPVAFKQINKKEATDEILS